MITATVTGELVHDVRLSDVRNTVVGHFLCRSRPRPRAPATVVRCSIWGPRAEEISADLRRGAIVVASGSLTIGVNREGRIRTELRVTEVEVVADPPDRSDEFDETEGEPTEEREP